MPATPDFPKLRCGSAFSLYTALQVNKITDALCMQPYTADTSVPGYGPSAAGAPTTVPAGTAIGTRGSQVAVSPG